jgi:hypothetical protein
MKIMIAVVLLLAASAMVGDVTGTWTGTFKANGGDHTVPQIVVLKQEGNKLTGSAGPEAEEQYPIENGRVDGDHVTFELTSGEWRFSYDLKLTARDEMQGGLDLKSLNNSRTAKVSLNRTKRD